MTKKKTQVMRPCKQCGTDFMPSNSNQIYCSTTCRYRAHDDRTLADPRKAKAKRDSHRNHHYKNRYNLSLEEVEDMAARQNGMCAICGNMRKLYVDHNHRTNVVRGLICHHCNIVLGYAFDSVETLKAAIVYLERET